MNRYYLAQVVTEEEYSHLNNGKQFGTGIIIEGLEHKNDWLVITVHEQEDDDENFRD